MRTLTVTKARPTSDKSNEDRWAGLRNLVADKVNRISDMPAGRETPRTKRLANEHFKNLYSD